MDVRILPTGPANLASIRAALQRLGATVELADKPQLIHTCRVLVIPGNGAFGAARAMLEASQLLAPLRERVLARRPTLAIGLGLHLLAEGSDEAPGESGLGVIEGRATGFADGVRTPHLGWNSVTQASKGLITSGHAWYAHGYRLTSVPAGWRVCWSSHPDPAGRFVAALERGGQMATQFHPELSGRWGEMSSTAATRARRHAGAWSPTPTTSGSARCRARRSLSRRRGREGGGKPSVPVEDASDPAELARAYTTAAATRSCCSTSGLLLDARARSKPRAVTSIPYRRRRHRIRTPRARSKPVQIASDRRAPPPSTRRRRRDAVRARLHRRRDRCAQEGSGLEVGDGIDAVACAADAAKRGAGEILLTAVGDDGACADYDLDLIRAVRANVGVPILASGRCSDPSELIAAVEAGADGVLVAPQSGRELGIGAIKEAMERHGMAVRR
jgi:imidazole glycerol phosphate synthase glutamine amidotransferase subunit